MQKLILSLLLLVTGYSISAQSYTDMANAYVEKYKDLAIAEQKRSGVPAAITLAQGIFETQAGVSELATQAHNHFGIKCKSGWTGQTFAHTDDAPNECFRKYDLDEDSYRDHSDYLKNTKRYAPCFQLSQTDYAGWAIQLRKCGYATNPAYAQRLIKTVEDFHLQQYTYAAMEMDIPTSDPVIADKPSDPSATVPVTTHIETVTTITPIPQSAPASDPASAVVSDPPPVSVPVTTDEPVIADDPIEYNTPLHKNGLKGFYAHKGDVLLESAIRYNLRYAHLLELNELNDAPLNADMFIYLEKKRTKGVRAIHVMREGETIASIAQEEGMLQSALRQLNQLEQNEEPVKGSTLELQHYSAIKPSVAAQTPVSTDPVTSSETPAPVVSAPVEEVKAVDPPAVVVAAPSEEVKAVDPSAPGETPPVNIANEPAVNEATTPPVKNVEEVSIGYNAGSATTPADPVPVEPQDEFSRLKSRLDAAVYNDKPTAAPKPVAAPVTTPAPVNKPKEKETTDPGFHVVKAGETAFSIAKAHNTTVKELMRLNQLNFDQIKVGQRLRVR